VSPSIDSCSRAPSFPTPRVLPFLSSPAFCRYYGGAKTPFPPALARTYLAAQSRGVGLVFIGPLSGRLACRGPGRCFPVSSWSGCWSLVWSGSPVFHGLPLDGLPCSSTPPVSSDLAYRSSDFAPVNAMTKALGNKCHFVAHSHGFPSRGLRFMPSSRYDDARLASSAALLAFCRVSYPLGRRCGVSGPAAVPRLSPLVQFVCLCHLVLSGFCFWGFPRRHAFARRHAFEHCPRCINCSGGL